MKLIIELGVRSICSRDTWILRSEQQLLLVEKSGDRMFGTRVAIAANCSEHLQHLAEEAV